MRASKCSYYQEEAQTSGDCQI